VVALENGTLAPLRAEGVTDLELVSIAGNATSWSQHASGWDEVAFPVMIDTDGIFYLYGAESYDIILVDKQGRLVTKDTFPLDSDLGKLNQRIRDLHAE